MTATLTRHLERAKAELRAMVAQRTVPSDPVALAASLGFVADTWQMGVLRSSAKRQLLLACRQAGKSTTTAVLALHRALFSPGSLVLLVSPSQRQSSELFRKVTALLRRVEPPPLLVEDNRLSFVLGNGSRVISLPGSEQTIRGFSAPDLIIEDEAARVDDSLHDAIRPMLAVSDGTLILLSTPFGRRGHFYNAWSEGGEGWERYRITAHECPRIAPGFLEQERRSLGDLVFRSEYLVEFCDTESMAFRTDDIRGAFDPAVLPLFPITSTEGGSYVGVA